MAPTNKLGDFTTEGLGFLQGMLAVWLYTTISQVDYVKSAANTNTIVDKICTDLTARGFKVNQNDVKSYVTAIRSGAGASSLADALINSNAVSQIKVWTDPGGGGPLVPGAMDGWTGGGHPSTNDLLAAFSGSQS